jgi:hypothetical protein
MCEASIVRPDPTRRGGVLPVAVNLRPRRRTLGPAALAQCEVLVRQEGSDDAFLGYAHHERPFSVLRLYAVAGEA